MTFLLWVKGSNIFTRRNRSRTKPAASSWSCHGLRQQLLFLLTFFESLHLMQTMNQGLSNCKPHQTWWHCQSLTTLANQTHISRNPPILCLLCYLLQPAWKPGHDLPHLPSMLVKEAEEGRKRSFHTCPRHCCAG